MNSVLIVNIIFNTLDNHYSLLMRVVQKRVFEKLHPFRILKVCRGSTEPPRVSEKRLGERNNHQSSKKNSRRVEHIPIKKTTELRRKQRERWTGIGLGIESLVDTTPLIQTFELRTKYG